MMSNLRSALRSIGRSPVVPLTVASLTAVGLSFTLGMWTIVDAAMLRPLPLPDPSALVVVWETHPLRGQMSVAAGNYLEWSSRTRSFSAVGGQQALDATLGSGPSAQRLAGAKVTPTYFDVWQVAPLRGRTFSPDDFREDARVAVLSARVWRQTFGGSETLVGSTVRIDGQPFTVVGIMPPESSAVGRHDLWVPWVFSERQRSERRFHEVGVFARLGAGVTTAHATSELAAIYDTLAATHPGTTRDWSARAEPLRDVVVSVSRPAMALLAASVLATFAVALGNVVTLLAGWWPRRRVEIVTRRALGASTAAIVRQLVVEGLLMTSAGAAGGALGARVFVRAFADKIAPSSAWFAIEPSFDERAAAAAVALFVTVVLTALVVPAWRVAVGTDLSQRRRAGSAVGRRLGVGLQVGAALVLAVAAWTLLDSAWRLQSLAPGDGTARLAIEVSLADERYPTEDRQRPFFSRLLDAIRTEPDVAAVSATSYVPPSDALGNMRFDIDGRPGPAEGRSASPATVDADAFRMLGIRLVRGRLFDDRDTPSTMTAMVVSESLAQRHWGEDDPVGATLRFVGVDAPVRVVGVVSDVRQPLSDDPRAEAIMYFDFRQAPWPFMTLLVEPRGGEAAAIAAVRRAIARLDQDQATGPVQRLVDLQTEWLTQPRALGALASVFGASTLLLTLIGIAARVAQVASRRRKECAIRAAVGATPARIVWFIAGDVTIATAVGLGLGIAALPLLTGVARRVLYGVSIVEPSIVARVAVLVATTALVASYVPTRAVRLLDLSRTLKSD